MTAPTPSTLDMQPCSLEQLPPDVQAAFRDFIAGAEPGPEFVTVKSARTPAELRKAYLIAQVVAAESIVGSVVLLGAMIFALDLGRGLMIGLPAVFLAAMLQWLWAGPRKQLARDPYWRCGLASMHHLVMRDEGAIRCLPLAGYLRVQIHVFETEGIRNRNLVLGGSAGEIAWNDLDYFGAEAVGTFAQQLHAGLQEASLAQLLAGMDATQVAAWFARGGQPPQLLRFCHASEQGMHGGETLDVFSDGRVSNSRWDPVAACAIPVSERVLPLERIRELAQIWVDLSPSFEFLPQFIPSPAGAIVFSLTYGEDTVHLQVSSDGYVHPTVGALREAFTALRR